MWDWEDAGIAELKVSGRLLITTGVSADAELMARGDGVPERLDLSHQRFLKGLLDLTSLLDGHLFGESM